MMTSYPSSSRDPTAFSPQAPELSRRTVRIQIPESYPDLLAQNAKGAQACTLLVLRGINVVEDLLENPQAVAETQLIFPQQTAVILHLGGNRNL